MGKITGFLEYERNDRDYEPVEERVKHWREFVLPLPEEENKTQAARCMDCGIPYCHGTNIVTGAPTGCPVNNQIPDWNDLVYRGDWEEAARNLHSTNNFPEVTGRVCPAPCEASCTLNIDDNPVTIKTIECAIADRAIAQGLQARAAGGEDRQEGRRRRLRPRRHGLRAAARARRPRRASVREIRQGRRPDALRHPRLQDGEAPRRQPRRADGGGRRHLPLQRPCRRERRCGEARRRTTTRSCSPGGAEKAPRPADPRPRARAASISPWISCRSRTAASRGEPQVPSAEPILADRQARRRHRRRRHRLRLHRHLDPAGRAVGDQFRDHAAAAGEGEQAPDLAGLAVEAAHLVEPRGRRRARFRGAARIAFAGEDGQRRPSCTARASTTSFSRSPAPSSTSRPTSCCWRWASCSPVHEGMIKALGLELDPRGNVKADTVAYRSSNPKGVRLRRHAARPVAGGVGDPRRPPGRARRRQIPDGLDDAAALTRRSLTEELADPSGGRGMPSLLARGCCFGLGCAGCCFGAAVAAAPAVGCWPGGCGPGARRGPLRRWWRLRRRRLRCRPRRRRRLRRRVQILGLALADGVDAAARPDKIVGAADRRGHRLAAHQHARRQRIASRRARRAAAEELVATADRGRERNHRARERSRAASGLDSPPAPAPATRPASGSPAGCAGFRARHSARACARRRA